MNVDTRRRDIATLFGIAMCALLLLGSTGSPRAAAIVEPAAPPDIVKRVAARHAAGTRGIVGFLRHSDVRFKAGPITRTQQWEMALVLQDGNLVRARILGISENGVALSPQRLADAQRQYDAEAQGRGTFREPFDPGSLADYRFSTLNECEGCRGPSEAAIAFTSALVDSEHANGVMYVDSASFQILRVEMTPNRFPQIPKPGRVTSETVTEMFSEALPGAWLRTSAQLRLTGRYAVFSGRGDIDLRFDAFRRYRSVSEALAAMGLQPRS